MYECIYLIIQLNNLINTISTDGTKFQQATALTLSKENFKHVLTEVMEHEISAMCEEVASHNIHVDER